jgi:hypothetical protein
MLGRQHKQNLTTLIKSVGVERAKVLYEACNKAFAFVNALIAREKIDCLLAPSGRFVAANTTKHLDDLEAELASSISATPTRWSHGPNSRASW